MRIPRPHRGNAWPLFAVTILALAAAGLALARQWTYGPALHWDAVRYLWVADNVRAGLGFVDYNSATTPLTTWGPLYPAVLAALDWALGLHPRDVAGPLNAFLFGATVFAIGLHLCRRRRALACAGLGVSASALIAVAAPLGEIASSAMSESLFLLLATLALIQAVDFLRAGRWRSLALAGTFTGLACLTRYAGVILLVAILALVLVAPGAASLQRRFSQAALYALIAGAPLAAWLARNVILIGRIRDHFGIEYGRLDVLAATLDVVGGWLRAETIPQSKYIPPRMRDWQDWLFRVEYGGDDRLLALADAADALAALGLVGVTAGLVAIGLRMARDGIRRRPRGAPLQSRRLPGNVALFLAFGSFAVLYVCAYVVITAMGSTVWGVEERHLLPLYVPLAVCAACGLDAAWSALGSRPRWRRRGAGVAFFLGLVSAVAAQLAVAHAEIVAANRVGDQWSYRYDRSQIIHSQVLQYVRENPPPVPYATNRGIWLYAFRDVRGADARFVELPVEKTDSELAAWLARQPRGRRIVYWGYWRDNGQRLDGMGVRRVATFESGAVFEIEGRQPP